MLEKLKAVEAKYLQLKDKLECTDPASDIGEYTRLAQEIGSLEPTVDLYKKYLLILNETEDAKELASSPDSGEELRELAKSEIQDLEQRRQEAEARLKLMLVPKDPDDLRNVIVEIRSGAGGEEASLFCGVLYRMYCMFAQSSGFKTEIINSQETELGGFKEVSFNVIGRGAYSRFKYESGVHRVQRVPETEASGRIHTSTATVAVLPEAEDVVVDIDPNDLEISAHRSSGAGGQHVNKTDSAIRILHKPTGIVVECQDERSQYKNRDKAMKVLRSKLYEMERTRVSGEIAAKRRSQVGTGDRSERIRTYNYPQGRVTDHRIGLTLYDLENVLNGRLDRIVDELSSYELQRMIEEEL